MSPNASNDRLTLHDAARAMGVTFEGEPEPVDKFTEANGLRFHYLEWGRPESPPMLLLHGFAQTCHSWDFVAMSFSDRFRVIAIDQRGHGDSDWAPDGDYSPETQQRDISSIVSTLELKDLVLVGLSMGGRNSFTYAANHPERVKALVIVDAAPENQWAGTHNIRNFVQQKDELDSIDDFVEMVRMYNPRRPAVQIRGSIMHNIKQLPNGKWTWKYDRLLRSAGRAARRDPAFTKRLWGYIESLLCPTLIVRGGASDVISMDTAEEMRARIPRGSIATVEGAGHLVMGDRPAGFEKVVTEFLGGLS